MIITLCTDASLDITTGVACYGATYKHGPIIKVIDGELPFRVKNSAEAELAGAITAICKLVSIIHPIKLQRVNIHCDNTRALAVLETYGFNSFSINPNTKRLLPSINELTELEQLMVEFVNENLDFDIVLYHVKGNSRTKQLSNIQQMHKVCHSSARRNMRYYRDKYREETTQFTIPA